MKLHFSHKHLNLSPHHHYQLATIFLFVFGFFLFFPYYILMKTYNVAIETYQWYFFWPWMIFYIIYCLRERNKIGPEERVTPLKRPIGHWVLLGLTSIAILLQPNDLEKMHSLNYAFIVFSIFIADGYWDFRELPRISLHR